MGELVKATPIPSSWRMVMREVEKATPIPSSRKIFFANKHSFTEFEQKEFDMYLYIL